MTIQSGGRFYERLCEIKPRPGQSSRGLLSANFRPPIDWPNWKICNLFAVRMSAAALNRHRRPWKSLLLPRCPIVIASAEEKSADDKPCPSFQEPTFNGWSANKAWPREAQWHANLPNILPCMVIRHLDTRGAIFSALFASSFIQASFNISDIFFGIVCTSNVL